MDTLLVALLGLALGALVNSLADDMLARRRPGLPRYADGRLRSPLAWLGVCAFVFNLRRAPRAAREDSSEDGGRPRALSWRYPLAEAATSALVALAFVSARDWHAMSGLEALIWLAQVPLFVLIAVIDIERRQVLLAPLLVCAALALFGALTNPRVAPALPAMLAGALCGGLAFSFVYLGGRLFARFIKRQTRSRESLTAFGLGDVYLMTVGGFIVGFPDALLAIALAILFGGIGALSYLAATSLRGAYERFSAMPYAPFILAAIYVVTILPNEALAPLFWR